MLIAMAGVPSNEKLERLLIERQCRHSPFDFRHHLFVFDSVDAAEAALELSLRHGFRQIGSGGHDGFFSNAARLTVAEISLRW